MNDSFEVILDLFNSCSSSSSSEDSSESSSEDSVCSTSSNEEHLLSPKVKVTRIQNYVSFTVAAYNESEFKQHFRLTKKTFEMLEGLITQANVLPQYSFGQRQVTPREGLLIVLWYLAITETFRQMSDRFGIAMDTVRGVIKKILKYFLTESKKYIKWPSQQLSSENIEAFYKKSKIYGAIGAIDGSYIRIAKPSKDQESFCNRKGVHSMILQGICDHKKRFIEIFFGEPGSQHDARVLRKSNVYKRAEENTLNIGDCFLLGDSAYPCLSWLIPPFKDDGNLSNNHMTFNYKHSSARVVIEYTFGLLKGRFRRLLHGFDNSDLNFIVDCVVGACILHNICINLNDTDIEYQLEEVDEDEALLATNYMDVDGQNRRNLVFQHMFQRPRNVNNVP